MSEFIEIWVVGLAMATLRYATPLTLAAPKKGGTITFGKRDIVDWMYTDAGVTKGNYSARAILKAALPRDRAAFKRRFGLEFDF